MTAKILYTISGTLWALEMLPQIYRTYKRKSVKDISILFPLICSVSFICFLIASFITKHWILIFTHIFPFVCNVIFLGQVICYRTKKRP